MEVTTTPGSTPAFTMRYDFDSTPDGTRLTDHWQLQSGHNPLVELLGERRIRAAVAENLGSCSRQEPRPCRTVAPPRAENGPRAPARAANPPHLSELREEREHL